MNSKKKAIRIFVASLLVLLLIYIPFSGAEAAKIERIAGENRYDTCRKISEHVFGSSKRAVIVSGEGFADALTGGIYADSLELPLMLSKTGSMPGEIETELGRLGVSELIIIGGEKSVENYFDTDSYSTNRISGSNRFETSEKVAELMGKVGRAYVNGSGYADALAAGPYIIRQNLSLVLTDGKHPISDGDLVFGGTALIPTEYAENCIRISGRNRYETSSSIADSYGDFSTAIIVSGEDYPDALSAVALSRKYSAPILLTAGDGLDKSVKKILVDKRPDKVIIVGGENAVSIDVEEEIGNILNTKLSYDMLKTTYKPGETKPYVDEAVASYKETKTDYTYGLRDYDPHGIFIDCMYTATYRRASTTVKMDENDLPMVKYVDQYYYNPVTMGQFALSAYADYLNKKVPDPEHFLRACDKLISLMSPDGSYKYPFTWYNYNAKKEYPIGWVTALAQGHALSCYSRAYELTKDEKYLEAGNKSLDFLLTHKDDGGVRTDLSDLSPLLSDYVYFEEYVSTPDSYTLNGYMFTLLGLYDWAKLTGAYPDAVGYNDAEYYFENGVESLRYTLHLFDVGGFSNYDLGFMNYDMKPRPIPSYHSIHIKLLHALHSITGVDKFKEYEELWKSYVD